MVSLTPSEAPYMIDPRSVLIVPSFLPFVANYEEVDITPYDRLYSYLIMRIKTSSSYETEDSMFHLECRLWEKIWGQDMW